MTTYRGRYRALEREWRYFSWRPSSVNPVCTGSPVSQIYYILEDIKTFLPYISIGIPHFSPDIELTCTMVIYGTRSSRGPMSGGEPGGQESGGRSRRGMGRYSGFVSGNAATGEILLKKRFLEDNRGERFYSRVKQAQMRAPSVAIANMMAAVPGNRVWHADLLW